MTAQPSNFSQRRAERLARGWTDERSPRLVSFGMEERSTGSFGRKGSRHFSPPRRVQVEMLVDVKHPKHVYTREEGSFPVRVGETRSEAEYKEDLGTMRRRAVPSGHFPSGQTNEVLSRVVILRSPEGDQVRPMDHLPS